MQDHQIKAIHKTIHKIDIADQIVKTIIIEIFTLDQTLLGIITQAIQETVHIQTLRIDSMPMTVQEIRQIITIKITQIIDHKTILSTDHIVTILKIDLVIILKIENHFEKFQKM